MASEEFVQAKEVIINSSYVDDLIDSFEDHDTYCKVTSQIDEVLMKGNFKIKEWVVSGQENKDKKASSTDQRVVKTLMKKKLEDDWTEKVLGIKWDTSSDKLLFSANNMKENIPPNYKQPEINLTRRQIRSCVNGLYDPCGLLSPFLVRA